MKNVPQRYSDSDIFNIDWPSWPFPSLFPIAHKQRVSDVAIWEEPNEIIVEALAPGMAPEDIDMDFSKGVLTISAQRKEEKTDEKKKFYQRSDASFVYRVTVPGDVDEKIEPTAELKNGLLQVHFKKRGQEKPKKISVKQSK